MKNMKKVAIVIAVVVLVIFMLIFFRDQWLPIANSFIRWIQDRMGISKENQWAISGEASKTM